ncbi:MAG: hypothetical protein AUG51_23130 [Acidobacteria bacterium 13_1_20CM_3_53_8]|nr:MAG: hypothetical protein AUG51_23130 [Acidobacteria bacterium 13_1_20CM_3_53_8]
MIGSGVKYVDAAYDENTFSRRYALYLAILLGFIAGMTMIWDQPTLIIFLSLIIGVTVTGKLDIIPFQVLTAIAVLMPSCYYRASIPLSWNNGYLIMLLSFGAAIDEIGNDLADASVLKNKLRVFFLYRGYLKVVIGIIAVLHYLHWSYAVAFMSFDIGYLLVTRLSERRVAQMEYASRLLVR